MKVVKWLLAGTAVVVILLFGIGYFLPGAYSVERSITINAPLSDVREAVVDLEKWQDWEPWARADESMEVSFGETTRGVGAVYRWTGDRTGDGQVRIIAAEPREIRYQLQFNGDDTYPAFSEMILDPLAADRTETTWTFRGEIGSNPFNRLIGLLIEPMVGKSYESGLESLKEFCESGNAAGDRSAEPAG